MIVRLVTLLAVLAISVVTTVASADASRMGGEQYHPAQVRTTVQAFANSARSCEDAEHCGQVGAERCHLLCAGSWALLTSPGTNSGLGYGFANRHFPAEVSHASHAPGLHKRPPKLRIL